MKKYIALLLILLSSCSPFMAPPQHGYEAQNAKQAKQSYHYAHHHLNYINHQGRVSGFAPHYRLSKYPRSFYEHLSENPWEVNLYADLCHDIYHGLKIKHGRHIDVQEVEKVIGKQKLIKIGYKVVATFQRWNQFSGALLYNERLNTLLVAFSGTSTLRDVMMDLKFTRYHKADKHGIVPQGYNVHAGVAQALIDSLDDFTPKFFYTLGKKALRKKDLHIITMGHSLGGGIAVLTADYLARHQKLLHRKAHSKHKIQIQSITFGMPRIFSSQTAKQVEKRLGKGNMIRFWGSLDPIPAVVSAVLTNSRHVGLNFKIQDSLWRYTLPGLGWHRMGWYAKRAQKAFCKYVWESQHRLDVERAYDYTHQLYHRFYPSLNR